MTAKIKIKNNPLIIGIVILFFVSEYYILNPLLNLLNFLLNYSDVGIPSMHNRNFLFSCNILYEDKNYLPIKNTDSNLVNQLSKEEVKYIVFCTRI